MLECGLEISVPDWVIEHPEALAVFQKLGIDYSCGGRSLEYACRQQGLDAASILEQLRSVIENTDDGGRSAAPAGRAAYPAASKRG